MAKDPCPRPADKTTELSPPGPVTFADTLAAGCRAWLGKMGLQDLFFDKASNRVDSLGAEAGVSVYLIGYDCWGLVHLAPPGRGPLAEPLADNGQGGLTP